MCCPGSCAVNKTIGQRELKISDAPISAAQNYNRVGSTLIPFKELETVSSSRGALKLSCLKFFSSFFFPFQRDNLSFISEQRAEIFAQQSHERSFSLSYKSNLFTCV